MRNTVRYLLSNLNGFDPSKDLVATQDMLALDRWILNKTAQLQKQAIKHYDQFEFHQLYQALHNFCSLDLGSLYLDIIKDRVYTMQTDSLARRSAQSAAYHIAQALLRLLAPILSFTAEEAYSHIPENNESTIFTKTWYEELPLLDDNEYIDESTWDLIFDVRQHVMKSLEESREKGVIGSGLEAEVAVYCQEQTRHALSLLSDELRFVFITSSASILEYTENNDGTTNTLNNGEKLQVSIVRSKHTKCVRCWHLREDVGQNSEHPELCSRCIENVDGAGETRQYA